jgi:hypothetical protein
MSFISGVLKWLESKAFLGEVVKDYGIISEHKMGGTFHKTSILLCKHQGKLQIVVKTAAFAYLSAGVKYEFIPASCASQLKEIMVDVERRNLEAQELPPIRIK